MKAVVIIVIGAIVVGFVATSGCAPLRCVLGDGQWIGTWTNGLCL